MTETEFTATLKKVILELTGNEYGQPENYRLISKHVRTLMARRRVSTLEALLSTIENDQEFFDEFISCITIHHTSWFRESKQFQMLEKQAREHNGVFEVLCAACSTGEEAYSIGLTLERIRLDRVGFDYRILALDIDQKSLGKALNNEYDRAGLATIPPVHRRSLAVGDRSFGVNSAIRSRVRFQRYNLLMPLVVRSSYDAIFMRHLLIYLSSQRQHQVLAQTIERLKPGARLYLGTSEAKDYADLGIRNLSGSVFDRAPLEERKKLLIIEDSMIIQKLMGAIFKGAPFDLVFADSLREADRVLAIEKIDALSLDIYLPDGLGTKWLKAKYEAGFRVPTMIVSHVPEAEARETLQDILRYAHGYFEKSSIGRRYRELRGFYEQSLAVQKPEKKPGKVIEFESYKHSQNFEASTSSEVSAILIGASTGGPSALMNLLRDWPAHSAPVVVVQHIDPHFLIPFAQTLAATSGLQLWDGVEGPLKAGYLYIALDDYHVKLQQVDGKWWIRKDRGPAENHHRPSVDTLFASASASVLAKSLVGVVLTGMGRDGARGLKSLRDAGAVTLVQDQESSVVWGMPGEAVKLHAAQKVTNVAGLRTLLLSTTFYQSRRLFRS